MKKFTLFFIFFYFIFNIEGNAYAHNEDKFIFLICENYNNSSRYEVHIDFKNKTVSSFNMKEDGDTKYEIAKTTERWIYTKSLDNDNERIIIHRYVEEARFQEFKDDKWQTITSGRFECEKINKKF
tara:strand:+ start:214 stop:591 length:378 start_codon:yes stop_codon:yes gene_type:complete